MKTHDEAHMRSIIKALSWRCFATIATIIIVYFFTRKWVLSIGIGAVEVVTKLTLYYIHERVWILIPFGRKRHPLARLPLKEYLKEEDVTIIQEKLKELGYVD